jgi:hypothetical protein
MLDFLFPAFLSKIPHDIILIVAQLILAVILKISEGFVRRHKNKLHVLGVLVLAILASYYTGTTFAVPGAASIWEVLGLFIGFTVSWGMFFHMVAMYWGKDITAKIGGWWVKGIDYAYLTLSFVGLMRIVLQSMEENTAFQTGLKSVTVFAVLIIAVGVALRMTKTSIEIFEWG